MEHSIEELKRQYDAAVSTTREAERKESAALCRLNAAKSKASGLEGKWLQEEKTGRIIYCTFVGERSGDFSPRGPRLLKSGHFGESISFSWRNYVAIDRPSYAKAGGA